MSDYQQPPSAAFDAHSNVLYYFDLRIRYRSVDVYSAGQTSVPFVGCLLVNTSLGTKRISESQP